MKLSERQRQGIQLSAMVAVSMLSQVIGIFKSSVVAANFGAGMELDSYNFATSLITFVTSLVTNGITVVVIPAYIKKADRKDVDSFVTLLFIVSGVILTLLAAFAFPLASFLAGRGESFSSYVAGVMPFAIVIQAIPMFLGLTTAYYQCENRFNTPKVILLVSNVVVACALLLIHDFSIYEYLMILITGALVQFVLDLSIALKLGFRYRPRFSWTNKGTRSLVAVFLPTMFSSSVYAASTLIDSVISSGLGEGYVTILTYANNLVGMVNTLIIGNLSTYAYPKIVKAVEGGDGEASQNKLWNYSAILHAIVCFVIVCFIAGGRELIGLLFEHGKFTSDAADMVFICMAIFIFSQQLNIVRDLIYRYFYALGDTVSTFKNSFSASVVNALASVALSVPFGLYGVIFGTVISGTFSLCSIILRLSRKQGLSTTTKRFALIMAKSAAITVAACAVTYLAKCFLGDCGELIGLLLFGSVGAMSYLALTIVFNRKAFEIA